MDAVVPQTPLRAAARRPALCAGLCAALAAVSPGGLAGQEAAPPPVRTPDVHFVPTNMDIVRAMLGVAQVGPRDLVYDLGCGDGRIPITAAKRHGARGVCVDIDPVRITESRHNADTAGVSRRITFHEGDLFEMDLRKATVVTLYLLPSLNERLRPKLFRELRPGTRVVSNAFDMGDWKPDSVVEVKTESGINTFAYYWVIPANVAGTWRVTTEGKASSDGPGRREYTLRLEQRYQRLTATATADGRTVPVISARIHGDQLSFAISDPGAGGAEELWFTGRVAGGRVGGTVRAGEGEAGAWSAVRVKRGPRPELEPKDEDAAG